MFDLNKYKQAKENKKSRYERQIHRILDSGKESRNIEITVEQATDNVFNKKCKSFVIYGEPQSGKTEMMITLTASLLDKGAKIIIILVNDNVQLLNQNLERFRRSSIDPAPRDFSEVLDPSINLKEGEWIIFSKKNSKNLQKLLSKVENVKDKIIIDDEADYATPNTKINKGEKTKINLLVEKLLGEDGVYIGVTATPARLDLNNTFSNVTSDWIEFPSHPFYKGPDTFFPTIINDIESDKYTLVTLPDTGDIPKYLREAIFRFLINVAYLNTEINIQRNGERNYSMLIHTSGKKADHTDDYKEAIKTMRILKDLDSGQAGKYYERIYEIAKEKYPGNEDSIVQYIVENISRNSIVVMNSEADKAVVDYNSATNPATLFTLAIGGNIVSRGVTFDRLLSMFFTRDVKHKIQQDTYIQRARMFGSRGEYLRFFELSIPEQLYLDWHKCFVFHRLSLESIRAGNGIPVWLEDHRVSAVSSSSIDKTTVSVDSGEMSFEIFDYKEDQINNIINSKVSSSEKLEKLSDLLGEDKLPKFLKNYISRFSPSGLDSLVIHPSKTIVNYKDANQEKIERAKGFIGKFELEENKYPNAIHHIKILFNKYGKARVFYKYTGKIKFLKNIKNINNNIK